MKDCYRIGKIIKGNEDKRLIDVVFMRALTGTEKICYIHEDDMGKKYFAISNPYRNGVRQDLFSGYLDDAVDAINDGYAHCLAHYQLLNHRRTYPIYYLDEEYGEEKKKEMFEAHSDLINNIKYSIVVINPNSLSNGFYVTKDYGYKWTLRSDCAYETEEECANAINEYVKQIHQYAEIFDDPMDFCDFCKYDEKLKRFFTKSGEKISWVVVEFVEHILWETKSQYRNPDRTKKEIKNSLLKDFYLKDRIVTSKGLNRMIRLVPGFLVLDGI